MMTIANRLRGTYGWFAKVNGVALELKHQEVIYSAVVGLVFMILRQGV